MLEIIKKQICPICGKELIEPYGRPPHFDGEEYWECKDWNCGFSFTVGTIDGDLVKLQRDSLKSFEEYMNAKVAGQRS